MFGNKNLDNKETFLHCKKENFSESQKTHFSEGINHDFGPKIQFFLRFVSVKIRLEIMFNHFFDYKKENRPFNELNSLRVLLPTFKPVLKKQSDLLQDRCYVGDKMRNIAIQLVMQQCCKTSCTLFVASGLRRYFR